MYHDNIGFFPPGYIWHPDMPGANPDMCPNQAGDFTDTAPGWGWAALLLPYLEQDNLRRQIDLNVPVEASQFESVRTTVLSIFVCPTDQSTGVYTMISDLGTPMGNSATNSYAACYGTGTRITPEPDRGNGLFFRNSRIRLADIADGSSNTLAIGERAARLTRTPWCGAPCEGTLHITPGAPTDSTAVSDSPCQPLAQTGSHSLNDRSSDPDNFFTPHPATGQFLYADGSVHSLAIHLDLTVLQALSTRSGGEVVNDVDF
jgi:prepilin-type processing-associated H-X9-DG protein